MQQTLSKLVAAYQGLEEINKLQAKIIDDLFLLVCQHTEVSELSGIIKDIEKAAKENEKRGQT